MVTPTRPPRNRFNTITRQVYNPLGFQKAYNFILFFIFAGALLGFTLARFMYLNFNGIFCPKGGAKGMNGAAPGECYYYLNFTQYKVGILLHLAGILPAGLLVILQFVPAIRHRAIIFHRINGYIVLLLLVVSLAGVFMIARHAFGGGLDIQAWIGVVSIMALGSFILAYTNIKRLQIEQHRAWMLRGWFYAACIITQRLILIIAGLIITTQKTYYTSRPCAQLAFIHGDESTTLSLYPTCASYFNGTDPSAEAVVHANFNGTSSEIGASLGMSFGMACWLALWLHAVGVEVYLRLTPREAQHLRKVSYQRQLEAGMRNPGRAGLTGDKLGDADLWEYKEER